jgi:hypothetical protein
MIGLLVVEKVLLTASNSGYPTLLTAYASPRDVCRKVNGAGIPVGHAGTDVETSRPLPRPVRGTHDDDHH